MGTIALHYLLLDASTEAGTKDPHGREEVIKGMKQEGRPGEKKDSFPSHHFTVTPPDS